MMNQRGFSLINIAGLTISMTCTLLLVLYIQDELSYDNFHPDANRIYRVASEGKLQGSAFNSAETGASLARAIQQQVQGAESVIRIANWPTFPVSYKGNSFTEPRLLLADSNLFSFFNFPLVHGNPAEALKGKANILVTESAAKRYFEVSSDQYDKVIGEQLLLAQGYQATVSGVIKDPPSNSHFHFTLILSLDSWEEVEQNGWLEGNVKTYVKMKEPVSTATLDQQLQTFVDNEIFRELKRIYGADYNLKLSRQGNYLKLYSQTLKDIHLKSQLNDEIEANSDIQYIYLFGAVALFITILACINFVNLSTARSASRAKEVGVRKTVGARNRTLILQFLTESYLYTLIAVALSILLIWLSILPFNLIADKNLSVRDLFQPYFLGAILIFIFSVGLFAGSYPAFFLTYFSPAQILKGSLRSGVTSHKIRNVLVGFQFLISIALIIATAIVHHQLHFVQKQQIGFNRDNIINLLHTANLKDRALEFKTELLKQPGVVSAGFSNRMPPNMDWEDIFRYGEPQKEYLMGVYEMDEDHLKTMGYKITKGNFFTGTPADTASIIINETAAQQLGITQVNGQIIESNYHANRNIKRKVVGIIQDFNFKSLKTAIEPMVVLPSTMPNWEMAIRIESASMGETLDQIEAVWQKYALGAPFEYTFVDDNYLTSYQNEERIGEVFLIFTVLAMVIASLGLFGLAAYTTEQRSKEIGIRKALGATHWQIFILIGKDFTRLVLLAFLVAAPLTWWAMNQWLQQYPYRIEIPTQTILLSGVLSLLITLVTISTQTIKAANTNPVDSLRNE